MESGYIKLYRSLQNKGYYSNSKYVHLWVYLLMKASYQPKEYLINNKIEYLKPGQFIIGRKTIKKETGISETTIERILSCFESEHQIGQQKNNKFRIISILNWNEYQTDGYQNGQQTDNKRTTNGQQTDTINNIKNNKNINNNKRGTFQVPSFEEIKIYCQQRNNKVNAQTFINHYISNGWMVGKNKMKDWKAAVRTWEQRSNENGNAKTNRTGNGNTEGGIGLPAIFEGSEKPSDIDFERNLKEAKKLVGAIASSPYPIKDGRKDI